MLDRHGGVLCARGAPERGHERWVELSEVAPALLTALVASEDRRFYRHRGIDGRALVRAMWANLRAGRAVEGGSTLTQQTVRLLHPRPPGLRGKLWEAAWALRLERQLSKDEILLWYLNRVYFGHRAWGLHQAAARYFDERPAGLSLAEAATLVALLPAPSERDPWAHPGRARAGRERVLDRLVEVGALTPERRERAAAEPLQLRTGRGGQRAPHFCQALLAAEPGAHTLDSTLDPMLQHEVEQAVRAHLAELPRVDHAAVLVVERASAAVRAWVGSGDWQAEDGQNDGVRALRSPGSALKPFLYALAFDEELLSPGEILPDLPARFGTTHGTWAPTNYTEGFLGPVAAREALGSSLNLPAVALAERSSGPRLLHLLRQAGFADLTERVEHYGLGLVLGGGEVRLAQLAEGYLMLASAGRHRPLRTLEAVDGRARPRLPGRALITPEAAWLVGDVLSDPLARVAAFSRDGPLERADFAAVKTGTSSGYRDNWTVGWSDRWLVAVWVGNFDSSPMGELASVRGAAPLWATVLDRVGDGGSRRPRRPAGLVEVQHCALSGAERGPHCPHGRADWRSRGAEPLPRCHWHRGPGPPCVPAQYSDWAHQQGLPMADPARCGAVGADAADPVGTSADLSGGGVAIAWPSPHSVFYLDPRDPLERQHIQLRAHAPPDSRAARWSVDGALIAETGPPFSARWLPSGTGGHTIELSIDGRPASPVQVWVGGSASERPARSP